MYCFSIIETDPHIPKNPCLPSPCGPNAECTVRGEGPACSCLQGYIGLPPACRPECTINTECPSELACINQKCKHSKIIFFVKCCDNFKLRLFNHPQFYMKC